MLRNTVFWYNQSSLTNAQVCIDASISRGTSQILVLSVGYMHIGSRITIAFCKSEINHVDLVAASSNSHKKIVWFDISVDES